MSISIATLVKMLIYWVFLSQSFFWITVASFWRLLKKLFGNRSLNVNPFKHAHQDVFKSRHQVMTLKGFKIIEYESQTQDGAYVSFWRIIPESEVLTRVSKQEGAGNENKQNQDDSRNYEEDQNEKQFKHANRKPVLIQHGLLDCAISWFLHQEMYINLRYLSQKTLPYLLAKQGYDVWLGNNRGTRYSLKNSHINQYWEYSLDHLAQYDIPCLVEFILDETKFEKLIYIGHSQGTTQFLTAIELHPELDSKIQCFVGFGPVISFQNLDNHILMKIMDKFLVCETLKFIGFKSILNIPMWMSKLAGFFTYNNYYFFRGILLFVTTLCGKNFGKDRINLQRFGVILSHQPGGTSVNNVHQWIQAYRKGNIHRFDYGPQKNLEVYGQVTPPMYSYDKLKQMPFNFYLFRGTSDGVITNQSFSYLVSKLHPDRHKIYELDDYAHLDYVWSEDASEDIYVRVLDILGNQKYGTESEKETSDSSESSKTGDEKEEKQGKDENEDEILLSMQG